MHVKHLSTSVVGACLTCPRQPELLGAMGTHTATRLKSKEALMGHEVLSWSSKENINSSEVEHKVYIIFGQIPFRDTSRVQPMTSLA